MKDKLEKWENVKKAKEFFDELLEEVDNLIEQSDRTTNNTVALSKRLRGLQTEVSAVRILCQAIYYYLQEESEERK